nr:hypothetical protein [Tanacetum cinerariifolium]
LANSGGDGICGSGDKYDVSSDGDGVVVRYAGGGMESAKARCLVKDNKEKDKIRTKPDKIKSKREAWKRPDSSPTKSEPSQCQESIKVRHCMGVSCGVERDRRESVVEDGRKKGIG